MAATKRKKLFPFLKKNYFLLIFGFCILFVGVVAFSKLFLSKPTYVYVKVKVGQGLWWVSSAKPSIWHVEAINKGDVAKDLLGNPTAEILSKRYYRFYNSDQFDVYLDLKLKATQNKKTGEYSFSRSALSVGSPIELQFPSEYFTGTVIGMSKDLIKDQYVEKTIYLSKRYAFPWEYDAIHIGDRTTDGERTVFEVRDKTSQETTNITSDTYGNSSPNTTESKSYITVKAKVLLKKSTNQWVMGEDTILIPGRNLGISTPNFVFDGYIVSKIE